MNKGLFFASIFLGVVFTFGVCGVFGAYGSGNVQVTNSTLALNNITQAESCISQLAARNISTDRANSSLQEAMQSYNSKMKIEKLGGMPDYSQVIQDAENVCTVKDSAFKAQDMLTVFLKEYNSAAENVNLSSMDSVYNDIIDSYKQERFEDTISLINDKGYSTLSEVEASQTSLNLFYETTKEGIVSFFEENWIKIVVGIVVFIVLLMIFWRTIQRIRIRTKLKNLRLRKDSIRELIKKTQKEYFSTKKMSELEYKTKTDVFANMIRDINRQIPMLRESLEKVVRKRRK